MSATVIQVPERGSVEVSRAVWAELSNNSAFWKATEKGLVTAETLSGGRARIFGSCYVGRTRISETLTLDMVEKVPGTLAAMLQHAAGPDFRVEQLPTSATDFGPLIALLIEQFVGAVRRYASGGRQFEYRREAKVGSLIGGRLNVTNSIRLRARGLRHLADFDKNVVSFDVPVNRTVLMALREIERLCVVIAVPASIVSAARSLALLFQDSRSPEVMFGSASAAAAQADQLAKQVRDPISSDMLSLAAVLLSHESFEVTGPKDSRALRSWFLNLETLFERAVRQSLGAAVAADVFVVSGKSRPAAIFPPRFDVYKANPDLVLRRRDGSSLGVGDVKYKTWSAIPSQSDVYQLLVHAAAFDSRTAFLVFPNDDLRVETIGDAVTGVRVSVFGVEVAHLNMHLKEVARHLGVEHQVLAAAAS